MSVFQATSRYLKYASLGTTVDRRGRIVAFIGPARIPVQVELGKHRLKEGQRLDQLAEHYLADATAYWRIAALNDAMSADQIAEIPFVAIPVKGS